MKRINWIIISSVAILAILNLFREDKPLSIEPMYAETDEYITADNPIMERLNGFFYLRNFHDNKEDFKTILKFLRDSSCILSEDSTNLILRKEFERDITFCLRNSGYFDAGVAFHSGKSIRLHPSSILSNNLLYLSIDTDSKYRLFSYNLNSLPEQNDYKYQIDILGDSATVTLDYKEFNSDVLQQFINIIEYYRGKAKEDVNGKTKYIEIPNSPLKYSLKSTNSNKIEMEIVYRYRKCDDQFTIEIY